MFSAQQLAKFGGQKRITQETFDEAVRENVEDFDMEPEEAVRSAVEEFRAQGVDLANIVKTLAGGDIASHPAAAAARALDAAAAAGDAAAVAAAADGMAAAARGGDGDSAAVLHQAKAAQALADGLAAAGAEPAALLRALAAVSAVLGTGGRQLQADFLRAGGVAALQRALDSHPGDAAVVSAALQAAAGVGAKSEEGKAALMEAGCGAASLAALRRHGAEPKAVQAACAVLCTLTNPDDDTLPASRAFPNARALAKEGAAAELVATLRGHGAQPAEVTAAAANALRQVAANDEICQEVAAAGGVLLVLDALSAGTVDAALARPLCALLRQLASSDGNKALLVEARGLEVLAGVLGAHRGSPAVLEQALGLLTNVTLRNPEAAAKALECGCLDAMLELMRAALASAGTGGKENRAATAVQRQACMAIRNAAARSPDVRAALLDRGAEGVVRQVKCAFPACGDAGSAALRDLGLDNYS